MAEPVLIREAAISALDDSGMSGNSLADAVRKARGGDPPVPFKGFA